jgi:hypothetical protein
MKKKISTESSTEIAYKRFRDGVTLYALGMDELETKLDREAYGAAHSDDLIEVVREIKVSMSVAELSDDHFDVNGKFELMVNTKDGQNLLKLSTTMFAHFHADEESPSEHAENFANTEARLIFWPYFRQTVSDVTSRMYIPPITVPLTSRGK